MYHTNLNLKCTIFFQHIYRPGDNVYSHRDDDDYGNKGYDDANLSSDTDNNVDGEILVMKYVDFNSDN